MNLKRLLFSLFEHTINLFNSYYNGHIDNFTKDEIRLIKNEINDINILIDEIVEDINYQEVSNKWVF